MLRSPKSRKGKSEVMIYVLHIYNMTGGDAALLQEALNLREKRRQMGEKEKEDEEDDCWELLDDLAFRGLHWVVRSQRGGG